MTNSPGLGEKDFAEVQASVAADPEQATVDSLAKDEASSRFGDSEAVLNSRAARQMRQWAIPCAAVAVAIYLIGLGLFLIQFYNMELDIVRFLIENKVTEWYAWVVFALTIVILSSVPLTLAIALMRMISSDKNDDGSGQAIVTPQLELVKTLVSILHKALNSGKG